MNPFMRYASAAIFAFAALAASPVGAAQVLYLRDGTTRRGTIEAQSDTEIRLRMEAEGMRASLAIPKSQVERVETVPDRITPEAAPPRPAGSVFDSPAPRRAPPPGPFSALSTLTPKPPGNAPAAEGEVPRKLPPAATQPGIEKELPAQLRDLWLGAMRAEELGDAAGTLEALRILEGNSGMVPDGPLQLDDFCRKIRGEGFGEWMGRVHWGLIKDKYRAGVFDLRDVREPERPHLIAVLRQGTAPALEPLKSYFPPIDPKTGLPEPFKRKQLEGITLTNAIEVKAQAALAAAVLQGQLKLEPEMAPPDKAVLGGQLVTVSRILSRARDLEPAAKMAAQRAELERQRAEAKARREEERARARAALGMRSP
jgi:hypothetical protein